MALVVPLSLSNLNDFLFIRMHLFFFFFVYIVLLCAPRVRAAFVTNIEAYINVRQTGVVYQVCAQSPKRYFFRLH